MELQENISQKERTSYHKFTVGFFVFFVILSFWLGFEKGKSYQEGKSFADLTPVSPQEATILHKSDNKSVDFALFWKVWDIVRDKYVDKGQLDAREMMYGAIKGMLASTGDPYTTFFTPKENKEFQEELSGNFQGIGAEIGLKNDLLTIIAPLDDSPAQKAGLLAGDKILKINGESTAEMDLDKAVSLIRGPKDTEVKLTIFRNGGDSQAQDIVVKRDNIVVKSVKAEYKDNNIAVIRVSRFGDDTADDFSKSLKDAVNKNVSGIIIDLRNNPGGYLNTAVSMASLMLPKNNVVVMEEDSAGNREKLYAEGGDIASKIPTIVLINEGSASASEILSGALKDNRENVTLVGEKSFGKGSVQEPVYLDNGTLAKITVARWLTPSGKQINKEGIAPDVEVKITSQDREEEKDPQLDKALEIIKEKQ